MAFGEAYFGAGSGTIVFQDITCNGTEADLIHCRHTAMGYAHCNHNEDAGVRCGKDNLTHFLPLPYILKYYIITKHYAFGRLILTA